LAGVTQIVRAGEADFFHTRQQHTIKVAQVGRRLTQRCIVDFPHEADRIGLDPEVVEGACLAHDLGHPPFGHIGEASLDKLVVKAGQSDGFEGNAQSFRIITKLCVRFDNCAGLDLTRATLAACLKYPWFRDINVQSKSKKWSAYRSETDDFEFAREFHSNEHQTAEAALMDWADDIAYSVHDLEDFHRCGAIPWTQLLDGGADADKLIKRAQNTWFNAPPGAEGLLRDALRRLTDLLKSVFGSLLFQTYEGSREQRRQIRTLTSKMIGRYIRAASLTSTGSCVEISEAEATEVRILKQITRDYVISNPSLAAQQFGQKKIIKELFKAISKNCEHTYPNLLPIRLRYLCELSDGDEARFAADCIAGLTEKEAIGLHGRLYGSSSGSVLDPIVR